METTLHQPDTRLRTGRDNRPPDTARAWLLLLLVPAMIAVNALANLLPFNGVTTGEVSARYPTLLTAASWAFNIWTLIYIGLMVLAVYQVTPVGQRNDNLRAIRAPLIANTILNATWLWLFHHFRFAESVVVIVLMLGTLVLAYDRLDRRAPESSSEKWNVRAPLSIYLGWVTVATAVNMAWALAGLGAFEAGPAALIWASVAVAATGIVGVVLCWRQGDMPLGLTFLWALAGIAVGQSEQPFVFGVTLLAFGAVMAALIAGRWRGAERRPHQKRPPNPLAPPRTV